MKVCLCFHLFLYLGPASTVEPFLIWSLVFTQFEYAGPALIHFVSIFYLFHFFSSLDFSFPTSYLTPKEKMWKSRSEQWFIRFFPSDPPPKQCLVFCRPAPSCRRSADGCCPWSNPGGSGTLGWRTGGWTRWSTSTPPPTRRATRPSLRTLSAGRKSVSRGAFV